MTEAVTISRIDTEGLLVPIVGTAPLIMHKFSEKAKRQMLDKVQGRKMPKQPKEPEQEYKDALYRLDDGYYGMPSIAFKSATVNAARFFGKDVTMVMIRQSMFFDGEFSKIEGQKLVPIIGEPSMREDVVTIGMGGHELRYRPEFIEWKAVLPIIYVKSMFTRDSVLSIVEAGGMGAGVGDWRPERNGDFGTYQIDETQEITVTTGKPNPVSKRKNSKRR